MGELVAGIGDEVLLFAAFLILSACMYIGVLFYRGHGNRETREQPAHNSRQQATENNEATRQPTSSQPELPHDTQSTLRSRFNPSSAEAQPEPQSNHQIGSVQEEHNNDNLISIRLIISNETRSIRVAPDISLHELRNSHFREEVAQNRPVRFIFQGRVLTEDNATLHSLGITDGLAVHIHIGRPRPHDEVPNNGEQAYEELDLSRLFVPLFGVILGLVWVSMLMYPGVFTFITKIFLFLLSLGFVMIAYVTTFG